MRNGLRLEVLNFLHVEFEKDADRMASNPPAMPDPEYMLPSHEAMLQPWYKFDYYSRINAIALSGPMGYEIAHRRGTRAADLIATGSSGPDTGLKLSALVLDSQEQMLGWLSQRLSVAGDPVIAAWRVRPLVAKLATMALMRGVPFPDYLKTDITRKFGETESVLDVSSIYSQGVYYDARRLPNAMDFAGWCGFVVNPDTVREEWSCVTALKALEYLVGRYYGALGRMEMRSLWDCSSPRVG